MKRSKKIKIEIVHVDANGVDYDNITPGSVHKVVKPPEGCSTKLGYWVMGALDTPVLIEYGEFVRLPKLKRTKRR